MVDRLSELANAEANNNLCSWVLRRLLLHQVMCDPLRRRMGSYDGLLGLAGGRFCTLRAGQASLGIC